MHRQILTGPRERHGDIVYLCEHDVLYSPNALRHRPGTRGHLDLQCPRGHARYPDGHAVFYNAQQVSWSPIARCCSTITGPASPRSSARAELTL